MRVFLAVAVGAGAGGVARFYLATAVQQHLGEALPWGTMAVNVSGSLLLGFILRYTLTTPGVSLEMRLLLTTGFCGGYTTFSTYSAETAALLELGQYERAAAYAIASVTAALAATFTGFALANQLVAMRRPG